MGSLKTREDKHFPTEQHPKTGVFLYPVYITGIDVFFKNSVYPINVQ